MHIRDVNFGALGQPYREEVRTMTIAMHEGAERFLSDRESDRVLEGEGDTGTIVAESDISMSTFLLRTAIGELGYPASFSEESEAKWAKQAEAGDEPQRMQVGNGRLYVIDPVDGSGDRKFGKPGTPSGDGYTSLTTRFGPNGSEIGIILRPAHGQTIITVDRTLHRQGRSGIIFLHDEGDSHIRRWATPVVPSRTLRVNVRPAYPQTHFPRGFWEFIGREIGKDIEEVEAGGAGDSLSRLLLGELDLVHSGIKGDWKLWDTGPFTPAPMHFANYNGLLEFINHPTECDLWHRSGVLAGSISDVLRVQLAMRKYRAEVGEFMVTP